MCLLTNYIQSYIHFDNVVNADTYAFSQKPVFSPNYSGALGSVLKGAHRALRHCIKSVKDLSYKCLCLSKFIGCFSQLYPKLTDAITSDGR